MYTPFVPVCHGMWAFTSVRLLSKIVSKEIVTSDTRLRCAVRSLPTHTTPPLPPRSQPVEKERLGPGACLNIAWGKICSPCRSVSQPVAILLLTQLTCLTLQFFTSLSRSSSYKEFPSVSVSSYWSYSIPFNSSS